MGESITAQEHCQDEVSLLDDLLSVEIEIMEMQEERVLLWFRFPEVPVLMLGELPRLFVDAQRLVIRNQDALSNPSPGFALSAPTLAPFCATGTTRHGISRSTQVPL